MRIEVDSHTHTVASGHAYSTLAENARAAASRNIKLLAITDHGPAMPDAPHYWYFRNMRVIPRVMHGVGILRGIETNIVDLNGAIDADEQVLEYMDIVLASLHEPVIRPSTQAEHTACVIAAMASGKIDVFAHGGNPVFPIDIEAVAEAAAQYEVLVEINNSSFTTSRPGSEKNCAALARAVARYGGLLTFGSDAHIADRVGIFTEAITLLRENDVPETCVLGRNGLDFLNFLKKRDRGNDLSELERFLNG
jgi:putative hydrolase